MFGRTLRIAAVLVLTQMSSGCFYCCYRPLFCHPICGGGCGCASPCTPCASCYSPTIAPSAPFVAPLPGMSVAPPTITPTMPNATGSAINPSTMPFSSATYTHPVR